MLIMLKWFYNHFNHNGGWRWNKHAFIVVEIRSVDGWCSSKFRAILSKHNQQNQQAFIVQPWTFLIPYTLHKAYSTKKYQSSSLEENHWTLDFKMHITQKGKCNDFRIKSKITFNSRIIRRH